MNGKKRTKTVTVRTAARRHSNAAALVLVALLAPAVAAAQQEKPAGGQPDAAASTMRDATQVVTQPARDVGLARTKTPPLLIEASQDPYALTGTATCRQIAAGIAALNEVLGPDYGTVSTAKQRRTLARTGGQVAKAGGKAVVNSLIPFRGLVREATGAAAAERRRDAATSAGIARRGFLRGLQRGRKCRA